MNREIKFRGKYDYGDHEWLYGGIARDGASAETSNTYIISPDASGLLINTPVDPATVGQFTGLRDKNGAEIYEGDVVFARKDKPWYIITVTGRVVWEDAKFVIRDEKGKTPSVFDLGEFDTYEVVGNIHEPKKEAGHD